MPLIQPFARLSRKDTSLAGGKGASLGEMMQAQIPVPPGFVLLAPAFDRFLVDTAIRAEVDAVLATVDHTLMHTVTAASERITSLILEAEIPEDIATEVRSHFLDLHTPYVAVRSSATAEDGKLAAWAGQLETYLNTTAETLFPNIQKCWASLFTPRAIFYRCEKGLKNHPISVAVVVQTMVESEISGIAFSVHPVTEDRNQLIIEAGFGLGEAIVSGQITPDSYIVQKDSGRIIDRQVHAQSRGLYRGAHGGNVWKDISREEGESPTLSDPQIHELAEIVLRIERHYGFPCDIEWAYERGAFFVVQSRPITTLRKECMWVPKAHLNFDYFSFFAVFESYASRLVELLGFSFNYKYEHLDISYDQNDIETYIQKLNESPFLIGDHIRFIKQQIRSLLEAGEIYGTQKTRDAFDHWYEIYQEFLPSLGIIFGLELALERKVKSFLSEDDFHKVAFAEETAAAKEQRSMLALAKMEQDSDSFQSSMKEHLQRFSWLGNRMMTYTPFTEEQIINRVETIRGKSDQLLAEMRFTRDRLEQGLREVERRLDSEQRAFVDCYREVLFLRTERADVVCKVASLTYPLFSWVAGRLGYDARELKRFSKPEIDEMLAGGDHLDPGLREQYHAEFVHGAYTVRWGSWGPVREKVEGMGEIKGTIGCRGHAKGRVVVVIDMPDMKNVQPGDILVAPYTNPNMVPAMERSSAIVTNIGGMTSHAAIVSREFNKPCIIGTEIATQILKDGDIVEVDANIGVVRILQKSSI